MGEASAAPANRVSLQGWHACLALSASRLSNDAFSLDLRGSASGLPGLVAELDARIEGMSVEVVQGGGGFIQLNLPVRGEFTDSEGVVSLAETVLKLTTTLEVASDDENYQVRGASGHPDLGMEVEDETLSVSQRAGVSAVVRVLLDEGGLELPIFSYASGLGRTLGHPIGDSRVTSAFASFSPEDSSVLLLLGGPDDTEESVPEQPFDPHLLPNGETAVLWLSHALLEKAGSADLLQSIKDESAVRPRPLGLEIPDVTASMKRWVDPVISGVGIPGGIEFNLIQNLEPGVVVSATPASVEELDRFTAADATEPGKDVAFKHTEPLLRDCLYYYMKDEYRKNLLDIEKPVLPKEVAAATSEDSELFEHLARLQLAQAISKSDLKEHAPFPKIVPGKAKDKIKELMSTPAYTRQASRLYSMGLCTAHPRLSVYLQQSSEWLQPYVSYVTSHEYMLELLEDENPVQKIQDVASKISLLDLNGTTARRVHTELLGGFTQMVANKYWHVFARDEPELLEKALVAALEELFSRLSEGEPDPGPAKGQVRQGVRTSPKAASSTDSEEEERKAEARDAIIKAGRMRRLAMKILTAMQASQAPTGYVPFADEGETLPYVRQLWKDHPNRMEVGTGVVRAAVSIAVLAVFIIGCKNGALTVGGEGMSGAEIAKQVVGLIGGFIAAIWAVGELSFLTGRVIHRYMACMRLVCDAIKTWAEAGRNLGAKMMGKVLNVTYRGLTRVVGGVLAFIATGLSIWDLVNDALEEHPDAGKIVVDSLLVIVGVLELAAIVVGVSGGWGLVGIAALIAVGVGLALIRTFAFPTVVEKAANHLIEELQLEALAAA